MDLPLSTDHMQQWITRGGLNLIQNVGIFLLIVLAGWLLASAAERGLQAALERSRYQPSPLFSQFVVNVARTSIWIVALILGLDNLGVDTGALIAGLGASGLILGFALKDTLSNFASGALLLLYNPFDIDHYVEVAGQEGTVKDLTLVSTVLHTSDNRVVTIPNSQVWNAPITHYNAADARRIDLVVGIGYNEDVDEAMAIFREVLDDHELILDEPGIVVRVRELADSSVNFDVRGWTATDDYWTARPQILREIKLRLDEAGLEMPFPQRSIWMRDDSPDTPPELSESSSS